MNIIMIMDKGEVGNMLIRKFKMCSSELKLKLFSTFCMSLYTSHIWIAYTKSSMHRSMVAYHYVFRFFAGYPKRCSASEMLQKIMCHSWKP